VGEVFWLRGSGAHWLRLSGGVSLRGVGEKASSLARGETLHGWPNERRWVSGRLWTQEGANSATTRERSENQCLTEGVSSQKCGGLRGENAEKAVEKRRKLWDIQQKEGMPHDARTFWRSSQARPKNSKVESRAELERRDEEKKERAQRRKSKETQSAGFHCDNVRRDLKTDRTKSRRRYKKKKNVN